MELTVIYSLLIGALTIFLVIWRICQVVGRQIYLRCKSQIKKRLYYYVVVARRQGSSDTTLEYSIYLLLFVIANIVACTYKLSRLDELSQRCARLFMFNLVLLYVVCNNGIVTDKLLNIEIANAGFLHRWIGRVCALEGIVHAICVLVNKVEPSMMEISLFVFLSFMVLLSVLWLRRVIYEVFAITHKAIALTVLILLWVHIQLHLSLSTVCLSVVTGFWVLQKSIWLVLLVHRNTGSGLRNTASSYLYSADRSRIAQIRISLRRPLAVSPRQYVYITVPSVPHMFLGFFQSHPYMIAWSTTDNNRTEIVLLINARKGFSRAIGYYQEYSHIMVDGPYGNTYHFNKYDKILFMASGIGIAAHLIPIRHLICAHNDRSARVRRISLMWILETNNQENVALDFIYELLNMDIRRIFTCYLLSPNLESTRFIEVRRGLWRCKSFDIDWLIGQEWNAEAGNMLISMCGAQKFENRIRKAVRATNHDIRLVNGGFGPDNNLKNV